MMLHHQITPTWSYKSNIKSFITIYLTWYLLHK